jgi:hypothetical protein
MRVTLLLGLTVALASAADGRQPPSRPNEPAPPRYHAYWLLSEKTGPRAATEYPVLLLTQAPIDAFAEQAIRLSYLFDQPADKLPPLLDRPALTLTTYAKDSVWNMDMRPLASVRKVRDFRPKEREITVNDTPYRYEPADLKDVVRLLERPEGTRPIHRIHGPLTGVEQTARALKLLLQEQLRDEAAKK